MPADRPTVSSPRARPLGLRTLLRAGVVLPSIVLTTLAIAQDAPPDTGATTAAPAAAADAPPVSPVPPVAQTPSLDSDGQVDPVKMLLEQASYWRSRGQPARAVESLERVLAIGGGADALVMMVRAQAENGRAAAAQDALRRLRTEHPDDPRIGEIEEDLQAGEPDQTRLGEARDLARQGRNRQAVESYRQAFNGATPPDRFAAEYYQTLGGTAAGFEEARQGLGRQVAANPRSTRAQLAYAQLLSYQDVTRTEGIERLALLAGNPSVADEAGKSLRKALLWLPDDATSLEQVSAYVQRHPEDGELAQKLDLIRNPRRSPIEVAGEARVAGYEAIKAKRLANAEEDFNKALAIDPNDGDATSGLGLVRLRQDRYEEGRTLLKRALELGATDVEGIEATLQGTSGYDKSQVAGQGGGQGGSAGAVDEAAIRESRAQYARVARLTQMRRYAEAESLLRKLAGAEPNWGNYLQLGDIQSRAGKVREAEDSFRRALTQKPGNAAAAIGLAGALLRLGRDREAEALYSRFGDARIVGQIRAERLRVQARGVSDPVAQAGLYRAAVKADPANPWLRLELARALLRQGRAAEARTVMAGVGDAGDGQAAEAGFYFAVEMNDLQRAATLAGRVSPARRTPQMAAVQNRVAVRAEIAQATQEVGRGALRNRILALAASPDPTGARTEEIARTFVSLKDRTAAGDAVATALAASPTPTAQQRLAYASALLAAGLEPDAERLIGDLDAAGLPRDQRQAADAMADVVAAAQADRLRRAGRYDDARGRLSARLAVDPGDTGLTLALGRVYQSEGELGRAVATTQDLLERHPTDLDVRRGAVEALLAMGDLDRADALAAEGLSLAPNDPRAHLISAQVARRQDDVGRAERDLRAAYALGRGTAADGAETGTAYAAAPPSAFRPGPLGGATAGTVPSLLGEPALAHTNPLMQRIEDDIALLQDEIAPTVRAGIGYLDRSGETGLGRLNVVTAPVEAAFSPGGIGRVRLQVTPTAIDGGTARDAGSAPLLRFGTNPLRSALGLGVGLSGAQSGEGVALAASFSYRFATVDIGTTPLGFIRSSVVGGIELAPQLTPELRLRMIGDRRAVINSALSYAGARDPGTGLTWGGVVRNRGYAQLEWGMGRWFAYGGAGGGVVTGERVRDNGFVEAQLGASYALHMDGPQELRVGLGIPYYNYAQNQNNFSFGHGGYFSPQNYVAVQVPVTWQDRPTEELTYRLAASLGYQTFEQRSAAVFPNNPALQAALDTAAALNPGVVARYAGQRTSGLAGAASAEAEYRVSDAWRFGGRAAYQKAGDYTEVSAVIFGRYVFDTVRR